MSLSALARQSFDPSPFFHPTVKTLVDGRSKTYFLLWNIVCYQDCDWLEHIKWLLKFSSSFFLWYKHFGSQLIYIHFENSFSVKIDQIMIFPKDFQNITEFPTDVSVEENKPTYLNSVSLLLEMMFFAFCEQIFKAGVCLKKMLCQIFGCSPTAQRGIQHKPVVTSMTKLMFGTSPGKRLWLFE